MPAKQDDGGLISKIYHCLSDDSGELQHMSLFGIIW